MKSAFIVLIIHKHELNIPRVKQALVPAFNANVAPLFHHLSQTDI